MVASTVKNGNDCLQKGNRRRRAQNACRVKRAFKGYWLLVRGSGAPDKKGMKPKPMRELSLF